MVEPGVIVQDLFDQRPEVIPVFLRHRMTCPGCAMARFETVREVASIYQLPLGRFLGELRDAERKGADR